MSKASLAADKYKADRAGNALPEGAMEMFMPCMQYNGLHCLTNRSFWIPYRVISARFRRVS